jgi:hypothetical protein
MVEAMSGERSTSRATDHVEVDESSEAVRRRVEHGVKESVVIAL